MKLFLSVTALLAFVALATSQGCEQEVNCMAASGCRCASTQSPVPNNPQLVVISINDAISELAYDNYYAPLFDGRLNPDFYPVSATFFVPHEYTDYSKVNALYRNGHEIAIHSITKNPLTEYWLEASVDTLVQEFDGQRQIISRFANIPVEDITGARVPNMALAGDNLFNALNSVGIEYDATLNVMNGFNYFPFTLDFVNQVNCASGICPEAAHPGIWVTPIINLMGDGVECNNLQACRVEGTAAQIADWLMREFNAVYEDNRAPLNLVISSAWFMGTANTFEGLTMFLDNLQAMNDVYIVSNRKAVEWMKNPSGFTSDTGDNNTPCTARSCALPKDDETRYMVSCVACPSVFPWLGNPLGTN
ncbi:chitin deacetylase-like 9 isoform a [Holotrichia oblita]|uniref:Chitin deacetylase-like 9 isoform a n=2 Tax=Holotrichia oblita TaxID=644536 RepID=A0ACB9TGT5_HOLOL|nr:chitin deacetylase-like 9 isoform a [Holotrichia oblita]KAI4466002.1 chitin deacetylase-like 9 isoform a [Holotrichia oblita]